MFLADFFVELEGLLLFNESFVMGQILAFLCFLAEVLRSDAIEDIACISKSIFWISVHSKCFKYNVDFSYLASVVGTKKEGMLQQFV